MDGGKRCQQFPGVSCSFGHSIWVVCVERLGYSGVGRVARRAWSCWTGPSWVNRLHIRLCNTFLRFKISDFKKQQCVWWFRVFSLAGDQKWKKTNECSDCAIIDLRKWKTTDLIRQQFVIDIPWHSRWKTCFPFGGFVSQLQFHF